MFADLSVPRSERNISGGQRYAKRMQIDRKFEFSGLGNGNLRFRGQEFLALMEIWAFGVRIFDVDGNLGFRGQEFLTLMEIWVFGARNFWL